jgi:hypothetical protein
MSSIYPSASSLTPSPAAAWLRFRPALLVAAVFLTTQGMSAQQAQSPAGSPATSTAKKSPRHRTPAPAPAPVEQPAPDPPAPEVPHWPVNDTPVKPSVTWDSQGLRIQAANSSLHEILNQVSADTGAKVEGIGTDERVFGEFGPGTARDVVSQLLHGSSYNVLMIGDQGAGTPRQIVLSTRRTGNASSSANRPVQQDSPDEDVPEQPEADDTPVQPPMVNGRPPMQMVPQGPPGAPRTPQQVLQELQQRQQQMQDQQQQQQQQQPH